MASRQLASPPGLVPKFQRPGLDGCGASLAASSADMSPQGCVTAWEAARLLGVSVSAVQRAALRGYIAAAKVGGVWRIEEAALQRLGLAQEPPLGGLALRHPAAWMPGFVSGAEAARRLGVTAGYVGTLARYGRIQTRRVGSWLVISDESLTSYESCRADTAGRERSREISRLILGGSCPWCGRTALVVPARHVAARHGVDRRQLRRLMGVTARTSICAPARSRQQRDRNARPEHLLQLRSLAPWKTEVTPHSRTPRGASTPPLREPDFSPPVPHRKTVDLAQRARVLSERETGMTFRAIGEREGLSEATALRICRGYR